MKPSITDLQSLELFIECMEKQEQDENHMELYEKLDNILKKKLNIKIPNGL